MLPLNSSNETMSVARGNVLYGDARRPEGRAVRAVCNELQPFLLELFGGGEFSWSACHQLILTRRIQSTSHGRLPHWPRWNGSFLPDDMY